MLRARWEDEDYGGAKQFGDFQWDGGCNERNSTVMFVTDPVVVPEVLGLITRCTRTEDKKVKVNEYNHPLQSLPMELKLMLLDSLEYPDIKSALSALGWEAPARYWKHRFRGEIFFEINTILVQDTDWYSLWLDSEQLLHHYPPLGLANRRRIFKILGAIILEFKSYREIRRAGASLTRMDPWTVTYSSPKVNELVNVAQAVCVPAVVDKVLFSFTHAGAGDGRLLCGIKFLPEGSSLGALSPRCGSSSLGYFLGVFRADWFDGQAR